MSVREKIVTRMKEIIKLTFNCASEKLSLCIKI